MSSERDRVGHPDTLTQIQEQIRIIEETQRQRVLLTATALSRDKRVRVTVNTNGMVIETRFASDISQVFTADELAKTVTEVVQAAAAAVDCKNQELIASLAAKQALLPRMPEPAEGISA
ncbi:YbaB/EbfC family nucleoid-associated protein [Nocardia sp. NBC_01730]|uniref:YbaB/EbfC family nucleoid-associated protein n=1 Tax=Nocardia sp. NBC_01730 TaxID=2975998 RepID=UPI002E149CB0|nr:YbaB/EbfC family nucleoid-associated protein [Nocardia sp. NBC_01730]